MVETILFSPLCAAALITLFGLRRPKFSAGAALVGILVSLIGSIFLFWFHAHATRMPAETSYDWIRAGSFRVPFGFLLDPLSILMLLVVTGVGSCIFFYSVGYMKGDESTPRYFASLSLFAFSMLGIVLANNFMMLFVFWELVAVSSYLLIGFWFEKPSAAEAAQKAFIVNRLADFGLVVGIFTVWVLSGAGGGERTFVFSELSRLVPDLAQQGVVSQTALGFAALLVFCGVIGKSAQFPLYIWLPDAMEGPTPVSALIHAATMVAAGVYLVARSYFLVEGAGPAAHGLIAWTGAVTALLAAGLAVVQNDIKKILAYSTISQLGYMVIALGLGSSTVAMYHLTTHAFFKALLFLGAGAMIHALHTQDIREMGGLFKHMKITATTFLVGTLALCGIPPLSGFFSKDEILLLAFEHNRPVYALALLTAALTAFYMSRAVWVAVLRPRDHAHAHEAPPVMTIPLLLLAALSVVGGFIGIPQWLEGAHAPHEPLNLAVAGTSVAVALLGLAAGTFLYARQRSKEDPLTAGLGGLYRVLAEKYYLDEFFLGLAGFFQDFLAGLLDRFDANVVIRKGVNGVAGLTGQAAALLRRAQTGRVQTYAMAFGFGVLVLVFWVLRG